MDILLEEESIVVAFGIIIALSVYYSPVNHTQSYEDFYFKISQESSILFIILYSIARFLAAQNVLDVSLVGKISNLWNIGKLACWTNNQRANVYTTPHDDHGDDDVTSWLLVIVYWHFLQ